MAEEVRDAGNLAAASEVQQTAERHVSEGERVTPPTGPFRLDVAEDFPASDHGETAIGEDLAGGGIASEPVSEDGTIGLTLSRLDVRIPGASDHKGLDARGELVDHALVAGVVERRVPRHATRGLYRRQAEQ